MILMVLGTGDMQAETWIVDGSGGGDCTTTEVPAKYDTRNSKYPLLITIF
jgi:hypothetical protein